MLRPSLMRDLSSGWIQVKAVLFLAAGSLASVLLWLQAPALRTCLLLAVVIWSFCRAYYFAFYVVERYIDPEYRFSGLFSLALYLWRRRRGVF